MFYKVTVKHPHEVELGLPLDRAHDKFALIEADNIRTARNLATERIIEVEKATELELVAAGREGWPIISNASEMAIDDGQQPLVLPEPHAQTADTGEASPAGWQPSTGSAPKWLPPQNPPATNTGD